MMIDDEKLIDLVRSNEVLYNKFSGGYRFPDRKKAVWTMIAKELGAREEQCCKRWTNLRERYAREWKRMDAPSGNGAAQFESWPLFSALSFLKDHIKPRPTRCTLNYHEEPLFLSSPTTPPPVTPNLPETPPPAPTPDSSNSAKRRKQNTSDEGFQEACKAYAEMCKRRAGIKNEAVEGFGRMIVVTISDMSSRKQAVAMQGITDFIMKLKLEEE